MLGQWHGGDKSKVGSLRQKLSFALDFSTFDFQLSSSQPIEGELRVSVSEQPDAVQGAVVVFKDTVARMLRDDPGSRLQQVSAARLAQGMVVFADLLIRRIKE